MYHTIKFMSLKLHTRKHGTVKPKRKGMEPYFMSITHGSNSTDKLEVDGALILPPCSISVLFSQGILKLVKLINNRSGWV